MWCYYNQADEVELFINGKSQGTRCKQTGPLYVGDGTEGPVTQTEYHVMWRVVFEPGEVKVVTRQNGKEVRQQVIRTAGPPHHIRLTADRNVMDADGKSLAFVTVEILDKDGNLCPNAENQVFFDVKGNASIAGVDNGCQTSMERFKADNRKAFFGKCLVVLRAGKQTGSVTLTAKAVDLKTDKITLNVK